MGSVFLLMGPVTTTTILLSKREVLVARIYWKERRGKEKETFGSVNEFGTKFLLNLCKNFT